MRLSYLKAKAFLTNSGSVSLNLQNDKNILTGRSMPKNRPMVNQHNLWKTFFIFLMPLIATNILQNLSGTINTIFVGQMMGVNTIAAVAVFFPILFFLMAFVIGLSAGATVLVGQAWGAQNIEKVRCVWWFDAVYDFNWRQYCVVRCGVCQTYFAGFRHGSRCDAPVLALCTVDAGRKPTAVSILFILLFYAVSATAPHR